MKYINGKELLMFLEPPITRLSVFEAETVDAALITVSYTHLDVYKRQKQDCNSTKKGNLKETPKFGYPNEMGQFQSSLF